MSKMDAMDFAMNDKENPSKKTLKRKSTEQEAQKGMYDSLKGMTNDELYNTVDDEGKTAFFRVVARRRLHKEAPEKFPLGHNFYKEICLLRVCCYV